MQKPKDFLFNVINEEEKQEILSCKKLEKTNAQLFQLFCKNDENHPF